MTPPASRAGGQETLRTREIDAAQWHGAITDALSHGWRFAGLWAGEHGPTPTLRATFTRGFKTLLLSCAHEAREVPTIIDVVPAAIWDEREAHDLFGWSFPGHEPLRPLVDHRAAAEEWATPLDGRDTHRVAVGPIHAGVIESGHFRFSVVGERILHLDLRLFYKHRGLEAAAVGLPAGQAIAIAQRACAADAVTNAVAYAQACESAHGLWPQPDVRRARTLLLELERLYNHLNDISAICAGVGFASGTMLFAALKERAQRLNAQLTGHRFLFDVVTVGGSALRLDAAGCRAALDEIEDLRAQAGRAWRELTFASSLQERLDGVGFTPADMVQRFGGVGPVARAAGVNRDVRTHAPRLDYADFAPARVDPARGDVAARFALRAAELDATFALLQRLLERPVAPAPCAPVRGAVEIGTSVVESPRGQTLCAVELDGSAVARMHLRTGSYANWPLLALAARNELLPDFPLINKSFELCYACVDR